MFQFARLGDTAQTVHILRDGITLCHTPVIRRSYRYGYWSQTNKKRITTDNPNCVKCNRIYQSLQDTPKG